jgi:hypothetical protein
MWCRLSVFEKIICCGRAARSARPIEDELNISVELR